MKLVRIINIIEPVPNDKRFPSPYDCFKLTVDFGNGKPYEIYMNRLGYEVFKLGQELLSKGADPDLLEKYHSAIRDEANFDNAEDEGV